ncbi:MAG: tetratricopeptide repeat protein [Deltaproteobacteria bacterium]|nr:tetratricopeptide repeat protein [Deltaproteobacteria bacterium]
MPTPSTSRASAFTPIAELIGRLERISDELHEPLEATTALLVESVVQLQASVLAAAYAKLGAADGRADGAIKLLKGPPTLGTWCRCAQEIGAALTGDRLAPVLPTSVRSVVAAWQATSLPPEVHAFGDVVRELKGKEDGVSTRDVQYDNAAGFVRFYLDYRNLAAHGGRRWFEDHRAELAVPFARAVRALVEGMDWIGAIPVFRAQSVDAGGGAFVHAGILYAGDTPSTMQLPLPFRLSDGVLVWDPAGAAVPFSAFYHVALCRSPSCYGERVFAAHNDLDTARPKYVHVACGQVLEAPDASAAWREIFKVRERGGRRAGVVLDHELEPANRAVYMGEVFRIRYRVHNLGEEPITGVSVDLTLPPEVECVKESIARRDSVPPGRQADFEYHLRSYEERRVTIPSACVRYTPPDGHEVSRPVLEIVVPMALNLFPGLVGRDRELERLREALAHARTGKLRFVTVFGQDGVGKTVVLRTFLDELARRHGATLTILRTTCYEDTYEPLGVVVDLFKRYLHYYCPADAVEKAVRDALGMTPADFYGQEVAPTAILSILAKVMGIDEPMLRRVADQDDFGEGMWDGGRRKELDAALRDMFRRIAARGMLVVYVESIDLMHRDAWRLLGDMVKRLASKPALVLACAASTPSGGEHGDKMLEHEKLRSTLLGLGAELIDLRPLSEAEMAALFDAVLPRHEIDEAQKRAIIELAQGIPSWLVETIGVLVAQRHIVRERGAWRNAPGTDDGAILHAFEHLVRLRYESLEPVLRRVIDNAAVLGKKFTERLLVALPVHDRTLRAMELSSLIRQLREIHHIIKEGDLLSDDERELEFAHSQIHKMIYSQIDPGVRRELHRLVAELMEARSLRAKHELALANHWMRAAEPTRALPYLEAGAERMAKESLAYEEAIRCLARALRIVEDQPSLRDENWVFDVTRRLARLNWLSGGIDESLRLDETNLDRGLRLHRFRDVCDIHRIASITHSWRGQLDRAREQALAGRNLAARHQLRETEHKLELQMGGIEREQRRFREAEELFERCRGYARGAGLAWLEAEALRHLGILHRMTGERARARTCFEQALQLFDGLEGTSRLFGLGMTHDNMVRLLLQDGDLDAAELHLEKSLDARRKASDAIGLSRGLHSQARLLFERGRVTEARARIRDSIELKRKIDDDEGIARSWYLEGQILAEVDQWDAALEAFGAALGIYEQLDTPWQAAQVRIDAARVHLATGRIDEAREALAWVRRMDAAHWDLATRVELRLAEADLARHAGDLAECRRRLELIERELGGALEAAQRNQVDFVLALLDLEAGAVEAAAQRLEGALGRLGATGNPYTVARIKNLLGKAQRKAARLDRAVEVLEEARVMAQHIEDALGEALALDELGKVELDRAAPERARERFEQALSIKRRLGDERGIAMSRRHLERCGGGAG